jgi:hydrogenase expression/formation protein HypC
MCLAIPARIVELAEGEIAVVDMGGVRKRISTALVSEARLGDYVIVHVGHAIGLLDEAEALASLALFAELPQSAPSWRSEAIAGTVKE